LSVQSPIDTPVIPDGGGDGGLSGGAIAGIAVGGAIALLVVAFLGVRMMGNSDGSGYVDPDTRPPAQFNVASSEDVSAMEDPAQKTLGAGDASLAEYGDQRYVSFYRMLILRENKCAALLNDWRRRLTHTYPIPIFLFNAQCGYGGLRLLESIRWW
jgi:hypothetical protein